MGVKARYRGAVYTGEQIAEQVNSWVCPATGLGLKFLRFDYIKRGAQNHRCVVAQLPNGDEWTVKVADWLRGKRIDASKLDLHIIEQQVWDYGLVFTGWGTHGKNRTVEYILPNGVASSTYVVNWRAGFRPPGVYMDCLTIEQEVKDYGLTFLGWGRNRHNQPTIEFALPDGIVSSMLLGGWRKGHRPDGNADNPGCYGETLFARYPPLRETPGVLYYRKFIHPAAPTVYKIGITKDGRITNRFGERDGDYTVMVLNEDRMSLYEAFCVEQYVLKEFAEFKYVPNPLLKGGGNQECFSVDVLGLDIDDSPHFADAFVRYG